MLKNERILPRSLRASRISLLKSLIYDDTVAGYGFSATEKVIPDFSEKIATIFKYGIFAICHAEKNKFCKKAKLIEKILPLRDIIGDKLISEKIEIFGNFNFEINESNHPIQDSYINVFNCMKDIINEYYIFMQNNPEISDRSLTTPVEEKIINSIYNHEVLNNQDFRDRVVSRIISLQIKLDEMNRMINPIPGVPADPLSRKNRALNAGLLASHGEEVLVKQFLFYLSNKRPDSRYKLKNISELYAKHLDDFSLILDDYHENIRGKKISQYGHIVKYGATLTSEGLLRKLRQWSNDSEDFSKELTHHIFTKYEKEQSRKKSEDEKLKLVKARKEKKEERKKLNELKKQKEIKEKKLRQINLLKEKKKIRF